jgi:hypothetical protein
MSQHDEHYIDETAEAREASNLARARQMAIFRLQDALVLLQGKPSREHSIATTHIETAIRWLK